MKRLPTTVKGLDVILHGGLFEGGVYILEGPPGVGKTTLANQMAYTFAKSDVRTLYVTMLAESHARMLQHMGRQDFFDQQQVNARVFYISGYRELEQDGLKGVVDLLRAEVARNRASFLIIDGLVVDRGSHRVDESVRQFVHEVQSLVSLMGCTCLILTSGTSNALNAEQTMVDGIFAFEDHGFHWRAERRMQVRKFRGSQIIRGQHTFCITQEGLQFFPRLESLPLAPEASPPPAVPVPTGVPGLDAVLHGGGLPSGTSCVLIGHSGAGKTTVALAFAAAATTAEPGLLMSTGESDWELRALGASFGLGIAEAVDSGVLQIERVGLEDESMDEMGHKILRLVDEFRIRRFVVDGLAGMADTLAFPERGYRFLGRLLAELKRRGVTSVFTLDPDALSIAAGTPLADGVRAWFDNVLVFAPPQGTNAGPGERKLAISKVRGGHPGQLHVDVGLDRRPSTV